jgi:hypothetical protein
MENYRGKGDCETMIYEKKNGKYFNYKNEEFLGVVMRDLQIGDKVRKTREKDGKAVEVEVTAIEEVEGYAVIRSIEKEVI